MKTEKQPKGATGKAGRPFGDWDEQKARVIDAAWRAIAEHGLERASLRTIADELGASTGVIAHYFSSKRDLLLFAVRMKFDELDERLKQASRRKPAIDALEALALEALPTDEQSRQEWTVYLSFLSQAPHDLEFQKEIHRRTKTMKTLAGKVIRRAKTEGSLPQYIDEATLVDVLQAAVEGVGLITVVEPQRFPPQNQIDRIISLIRRYQQPT